MIISTACERQLPEFERLVANSDEYLNADAKRREEYYAKRTGKALEEDVEHSLNYCAKGTPFEGTIDLVSGQKFPDIVANKMFGVEVKSTKANHWTSTGSSILESTRIEGVERIFMTFGKLGKPVQFRSKPYEDCLSGIVVTHYPRYEINMQLDKDHKPTIFEKMGVSYDDLRTSPNPAAKVIDYYKANLGPGESLWWVPEDEEDEETATDITARLWTALDKEQKADLAAEGYVLFPELFQKGNNKKYNNFALWLATRRGIINSNIRDSFSAGGKVYLPTMSGVIMKVPAVIGRVDKYKERIFSKLYYFREKELREYWKVPVSRDRLSQWIDLAVDVAADSYDYPKSALKSVFQRVFIDFLK